MLRKVLLGMCVVLLVASYAAAQSTNYEFTTILNSKRDRLEPTRCAAINSQGTVAVQVRDPEAEVLMTVSIRPGDEGCALGAELGKRRSMLYLQRIPGVIRAQAVSTAGYRSALSALGQ